MENLPPWQDNRVYSQNSQNPQKPQKPQKPNNHHNGTNHTNKKNKNNSYNLSNFNNKPRQLSHNINHQIKSPTVRVVFEAPQNIKANDKEEHTCMDQINPEQNGKTQSSVMTLSEALKIAHEKSMDLIEINSKASPPVCKIMDYGKFMYKEQKSHKKEKPTKCKEIGFHVNIAEHDFQTKMRQAKEFLSEHHPLIFKIQFRGRECAHQEIGISLFERVTNFLKDVGKQEATPKVNGKTAILRLSPLGKK